MKKTLVALLITLSSNAFAYTGNTLFSDLRSSRVENRLSAIMYIGGVVAGFQAAESLYAQQIVPTICMPNSVTAEQLNDLVKNQLEINPETRHLLALHHIVYMLRQTFPCSKKQLP